MLRRPGPEEINQMKIMMYMTSGKRPKAINGTTGSRAGAG
jgi:hypothetical protein